MQPHLLRASLRLEAHWEDAHKRLGPCLDMDGLDEMRPVECLYSVALLLSVQ